MNPEYAHLRPRLVTDGLGFPEGPVACRDGSVLVTEIRGGCITRVSAKGERTQFAGTKGGPNGAAPGPDGCLYVCNNGGSARWKPRPWPYADPGAVELLLPEGHLEADPGPCIQRISADGSRINVLYRECDGVHLRRPNDIAFDRTGGFWFTDMGGVTGRKKDITGAFYAAADGSRVVEKIFPLDMPNGIGLSPDESTLYIAETRTRRLWACSLSGPGEVRSRRTLATIPAGGPLGFGGCDSLCVDGDGNIIVATVGAGGVTVISARGDLVAHVPLDDPMTTNACFGGSALNTLYVTAAGTGRLYAFDDWPVRGLPLPFSW